jgi:hypothetical protein
LDPFFLLQIRYLEQSTPPTFPTLVHVHLSDYRIQPGLAEDEPSESCPIISKSGFFCEYRILLWSVFYMVFVVEEDSGFQTV